MNDGSDEIISCKCCCRVVEDVRFGICFDCAECEAIIGRGEDMYGNSVKPMEGYSPSMARLHYILTNHPAVWSTNED